jgi:RNA polymerase sigma-70 factor (ECF subfamily)
VALALDNDEDGNSSAPQNYVQSSGADIDGDKIQAKLEKAIAALPEKQRIVFNLRYYDEMPYEQMSEVLQTSVGALKASYFHAAQKIEAALLREE